MRYYKVKVKTIFEKASLFHPKKGLYEVYLEVPNECKKLFVELTAVEKMKGYIKKNHPFVFKKDAYKIVAVDCKKQIFSVDDGKIIFKGEYVNEG